MSPFNRWTAVSPPLSTGLSTVPCLCLCLALAICLAQAAPAQSPVATQAAGPDLLQDLLRRAAEPPAALPLDFARSLGSRLALVWHQNPGAPMAYALPWAAISSSDAAADQRKDGSPNIRQPADFAPLPEGSSHPGSLFLHVSYLGSNGRMRPFRDLPVDAAEQLLHALLDVYLAGLWPPSQAAPLDGVGQSLQQRAEILLPDLPAWAQREAYLAALGDFGAHILSIANEVERLFARRGSRLCAAVDLRHTLFGLWTRSFRDGRYAGRYYQPAATRAGDPEPPESPAGGPSLPTTGYWVEAAPLTPDDKRLVVEAILGAAWQGDARADLAARHCSPSSP